MNTINNIRNLRYNLNMTQSAFAEYCDVSIISISRYEAGESISRRNAEKIAHACHVSIDYVRNRQTDPSLQEEKQTPSGTLLSEDENSLIEDYRRISQRGKFHVRKLLNEIMILYPVSENS